ncbi:hypothetical protein BH09MYX1_BH09MYX1_35850 [soil metagenome]
MTKICQIKMNRAPAQAELPFRTHGGRRRGAGRPRRSDQLSHTARPSLDGKNHPVHLTLRMAREVWNLRSERGLRCVELALEEEKARGELRVVHFSVQGNHLHLVAEANDAPTLSRRMQCFGIRLARGLNKMMKRRRGRVLADRYHARVLRTPREVNRTIRYVLLNHHIHRARAGEDGPRFDPFSSAAPPRTSTEGTGTGRATGPPTSPPETWVLARGWLRGGAFDLGVE